MANFTQILEKFPWLYHFLITEETVWERYTVLSVTHNNVQIMITCIFGFK